MTFTALMGCRRPDLSFANESLFTPAEETSQYWRFMVMQLPTVRCCAHAGSSREQHVHQHPRCTWHLCGLGPDPASHHLNSSHHRSSLGRGSRLCSRQLLPQVWNSTTVRHVHDISAEERRNPASVRQRTVSQTDCLGNGRWCTSWEVARALEKTKNK